MSSLKLFSLNDDEAYNLCRRLATGLSHDEVSQIRDYYRRKRREPTEIELQTFGQTWSEHCFHKIFKSPIVYSGGKKKEINGLFRSYIARATKDIEAPWIVSAFEDNAGIVKFDRGFSIAAKVETHNHPSAVEPFGGAATGVGGVIRDILGVWADPIANTDVLCFGPLDISHSELPETMKHPRYLMKGVVAGVGAYGNNMGIPTVNGAIHFDRSYNGYALVFCGCVGLLQNKNYRKSARSGDMLLLAGARTGRDGIHGVSFASEALGKNVDDMRPAVQIPDPIVEEKLKRAVMQIADEGLASAITDLGGGGLSSAVCETARNLGFGADVRLGNIPSREPDIREWELWLSESQERMLLVVPKENLAKTIGIFEHEQVESAWVGDLTKGKDVVLRDIDGREIGRLDLDFLFSPVLPTLEARGPKRHEFVDNVRYSEEDLEDDILTLLASPNIASREPIVRTYDHEVRGATVVKPFQYPGSGPNDAAVLKPLNSSNKGLVISSGFNPSFGRVNTYWMAASAIDEAVRNNVCVGGRRISLLDNFAWGDPNDGESLGSLVDAAEACYDVATSYRTPFISGKDSFYNITPLGGITPSLLITAIGVVPDISKCVTADFKRAGDAIYLVGRTEKELGGSEYHAVKDIQGGQVPMLNKSEALLTYRSLTGAIDRKIVRACHDISQGGIAVSLAEMCFANGLGATITLPEDGLSATEFLFSESNSRFLVEVLPGDERAFVKVMGKTPLVKLGEVATKRLVIKDNSDLLADLSIEDCRRAWVSFFK